MPVDMSLEARITRLEEAMADLAAVQVRAEEARIRTEESLARAEEARVRTEESLARTEESLARTEESLSRTLEESVRDEREARREGDLAWKKQWSELADKLGTLAEDIVAPGIPDLFKELFGVADLEMSALRVRRANRSTPGLSREFDYVGLGGGILLVNETKSTLRLKDILRFLRILGEIREYFPEAASCRVVGSLASMTIDPSLVAAGERRGLLMLGLATGLEVLNTPGFKPRLY